jgi:diguanylate cyclase (GGDEF)-like protein
MYRWLSPSAVRDWRLWSLPRGAVAFLLGVEVTAVAGTAALGVLHPVTAQSLRYFGLIVGLGIVTAEATRSVERMRRWFTNTPHVNMSSVWTLSAALLTTPLLAAGTAVILYAHLWARSWRPVSGVHPYRVLFNVSGVVLSCLAAATIAHGMPADVLAPSRAIDVLAIVLVIIGYSAVNSTLAALALLLLHDQGSLRGLVGSWQENSVEYATLCVGMLTAAVLAWRPWLVVLVLLPLHVLHRSVLIRQLEHAATTDEKTGLLNAATWHTLAAAEFERARGNGRTVGLLMADLDHFTQVNERFGRDVGDQALQKVGEAVRQELRSGDLGGRLGGEEFAILLADTEIDDAVRMANHVCRRVRALCVDGPGSEDVWLSVSIGVAACPDAGPDLDELLLAADNALFAAKDAGRDRASVVQFGDPGQSRPVTPEAGT